jgi:hypothetical protein
LKLCFALTHRDGNFERTNKEKKEMKKPVVFVVAAIALLGLWYAFRPELLFVNKSTSESFPAAQASSKSSAEPVKVAAGDFRGVAHESEGVASVYQLPDGKRVLRLTNFKTSNGPALHVYLVGANDAPDNDTVKKAGFVDLGDLKGNQGDQNYDIPAGTDLGKYRAVTVWCARFNVNFATAPLTQN